MCCMQTITRECDQKCSMTGICLARPFLVNAGGVVGKDRLFGDVVGKNGLGLHRLLGTV